MKNTVDAAAFYKAMTALMEVPSKSSIEVLREIRAEFTGDRCVLSATDLDTWMSVTITAVGDSFDFLFRNSANIQKVCRHYDGALELELQQCGDESFLTMRSGSKGGEFPVYDTKDCPVWPKLEVKQTYGKDPRLRQAGKVCRRSAQYQTRVSWCSVSGQTYLVGGRTPCSLL